MRFQRDLAAAFERRAGTAIAAGDIRLGTTLAELAQDIAAITDDPPPETPRDPPDDSLPAAPQTGFDVEISDDPN